MFKRAVGGVIDGAGRHPYAVLLAAVLLMLTTWGYAFVDLQLRSDFLELLPRESPGFQAFEHQLGRVGGGATLIAVVESPDREKNQKFVDDLAAKIESSLACRKACKDEACKHACGADQVSYVESGTKEVRAFYQSSKWLFADLDDLLSADDTLDHQIATRSGMVEDLSDQPAATPASSAHSGADEKPALGLDEYRDRWQKTANKHDDFPTGYFATADGTMLGLRIVTASSGMGDASGDRMLAWISELTSSLAPTTYHPAMRVGFAGDIPNAVAEKQSLISDALWAWVVAFVLILGGVVVYYRSPWSLLIIGLPALFGVGCAYAFATWKYGYVNTAGAFLGAIILGNGINYPIVLLSRYKEFRALGQAPEEARRGAVLNAFRAELVGACVASIAYGSLTVTRFRGFNQFGMIGFVGMLLVWVSIVPVVPALIVILENLQSKLPRWMRDQEPGIRPDGTRGAFMTFVGDVTARYPWVFVVTGLVITAGLLVKLPTYLADPWEYDFGRLGSRGSKQGGAGEWSNKADEVFGGRMNIAGALIVADTPEQVPLLKKQILLNDSQDPQGKLIADIATIADFLPGSPAEQNAKLEVIARIRDRLTPNVIASLSPAEQSRVADMRPPESLRVLEPKDVPALLRRRFEENNGVIGTVFYVKWDNGVSRSDGHNLLRMAKTTDNVQLPDGTVVQTASRSTVFAEMIRSIRRDGPLATLASFLAVVVVVVIAAGSVRGSFSVLLALLVGVAWTMGTAALFDQKLNFLNFIALPITFGIGCEYPFNIFDRSRLLKGDITAAVRRSGGAVALCSYTTTIGYGSMLVSDNQALQSFGRLAMSGEIFCLFSALFFLPSLLHVVGRRRRKGEKTSELAMETNAST